MMILPLTLGLHWRPSLQHLSFWRTFHDSGKSKCAPLLCVSGGENLPGAHRAPCTFLSILLWSPENPYTLYHLLQIMRLIRREFKKCAPCHTVSEKAGIWETWREKEVEHDPLKRSYKKIKRDPNDMSLWKLPVRKIHYCFLGRI